MVYFFSSIVGYKIYYINIRYPLPAKKFLVHACGKYFVKKEHYNRFLLPLLAFDEAALIFDSDENLRIGNRS